MEVVALCSLCKFEILSKDYNNTHTVNLDVYGIYIYIYIYIHTCTSICPYTFLIEVCLHVLM